MRLAGASEGGAIAHGKAAARARPDYGIDVIGRMFDVVAAVMHVGPASLAAIATHAGCNRSTAFRTLRTLEERGFVTQDGQRGRWRMGPAWILAARAAASHRAIELAAEPAMEALAKACREGTYLAMRDGQESETLAIQQGDPKVRLYAKPGDRAPLHAGPGRLLLAYAPEVIQRAVLTGKLPRLASNTRTDTVGIRAELPRIAARGWLITRDEIEEGAVTVSMPVRDSGGGVLAVLSIISPGLRMRDPRPHALLRDLMEAAAAVGAAIGIVT